MTLISELLRQECFAETRILVRSHLEDCLKGLWICEDPKDVASRLYSSLYWSRVETFQMVKGKVKQAELTDQDWWEQVDTELSQVAVALEVSHQADPARVQKVPRWRVLLDEQPALAGLDTIYKDCCSAVHRDGRDLGHFFDEAAGCFVDSPFGQPQVAPGAEDMRNVVYRLFLKLLEAAMKLYGLSHDKADEIERAFLNSA